MEEAEAGGGVGFRGAAGAGAPCCSAQESTHVKGRHELVRMWGERQTNTTYILNANIK